MKATSILSLGSLVLTAAAYGNVGTFERIWFWYAYQLDGSQSKVAPKCASIMGAGAGQRCSFTQLMEYINRGTGNVINPSAIRNVDTNDLAATSRALTAGGFTGTYDCTLVWEGLSGVENETPAKSNVAGLFQKLGFFCTGAAESSGNTALKTNLAAAVTAVSRGRQGNAVDAYFTGLAARDPPINLETTNGPIYDGAPTTAGMSPEDDPFVVKNADLAGTVSSNDGLKKSQLMAAIMELQLADGSGHTNNAKTAKVAAAQVAEVCSG